MVFICPSEAVRMSQVSPTVTAFTGLWNCFSLPQMCWNPLGLCHLFRPDFAQRFFQVSSSWAPFRSHHFFNEKPQNTSLVGYKIVCKANEGVINTLSFDRMRLPADGAGKLLPPHCPPLPWARSEAALRKEHPQLLSGQAASQVSPRSSGSAPLLLPFSPHKHVHRSVTFSHVNSFPSSLD